MKNNVLLFLMLMFSTGLFAQGRGCMDSYFPLDKGTSFQLTTYDKKSKPTATIDYKIKDRKNISEGWEILYDAVMKDKKGKELGNIEAAGKCVGDKYIVDPRQMGGGMMPANMSKDMTVTVSGEMSYPNTLTVGAKLPDVNVEIKTAMNGLNLLTTRIKHLNRKVEAMQKVTTPAGTFDCYKITSDSEMKLLGTKKMKTVEYISKGFGLVKSENYDAKGKLDSMTQLTKFSK